MRINPSPDPYFRHKFVIAGTSNPRKKWIILAILSIVIGLSALGWYFSSELTDYINQFNAVKVQPAENNSTPATIIPNVPNSVPKATQPTEIKPSTTPTTSDELVAKANSLIVNKHITLPEGENANAIYQTLLKTSPPHAQQVLNAMMTWLLAQGREQINANNLLQPKDENAYKIYKKMGDIHQTHPNLAILLNEIVTALNKRATQQLQANKLLEPKGDNVYATCQEILKIAPDNQEVKQLLSKVIDSLLTKAKNQWAKSQYTSPKEDNVYDTYQQILRIARDNPQAQEGLNKLAKQFYDRAEEKFNKTWYSDSLETINKGLQFFPKDAALLELKQQVLKKQGNKR